MGIAKTIWMESMESPWLHNDSLDDKFVCNKCIPEKFLKKVIKANLVSKTCTYCGKSTKKLSAAPLRELIGYIYHGFRTEWYHPVDVLSWDSEEGGWLGDVYSSSDMESYLQEEAEISNLDLTSDILSVLDQYQWCRDPSGREFSSEMKTSWDFFCNLIKYNFRYTFFEIDEKLYLGRDPLGEESLIKPKEFLNYLGKLVHEQKMMVKILKAGDKIYRARLFVENQKDYGVDQLGAPSKEFAKASRMSASGIPLFYASLDPETAEGEVKLRVDNNKYIVTTEFELLKDISLIDFRIFPNSISIFDPDKQWSRNAVKFLRSFSIEIAREIALDDRVHIEYVPTQVITEYFRYIFKLNKNQSILGILYSNAHGFKGDNCALFFGNEKCEGATLADHDNCILKMNSYKIQELKK